MYIDCKIIHKREKEKELQDWGFKKKLRQKTELV